MVFLDYLALLGLSALGVASAVWFFKKRREVLELLRDVTATLEEYYKPSDKTYTWIGYLVGYKARYVLPGKHKAFILFTTVPRHALFYMPVVLLANRRDRLEVAVVPHDRYVVGELHVHKKGSWIAEAVVKKNVGERLREFSVRELDIGGYKYVAYYKDERLLSSFTELASKAGIPLLYASAIPQENMVVASCEVTRDNVVEFLDFHKELLEAFTKPKAPPRYYGKTW
ncbi:MAG: hypothetical protein ACP5KA_06955 [Desulfurococcaceae archaeon]